MMQFFFLLTPDACSDIPKVQKSSRGLGHENMANPQYVAVWVSPREMLQSLGHRARARAMPNAAEPEPEPSHQDVDADGDCPMDIDDESEAEDFYDEAHREGVPFDTEYDDANSSSSARCPSSTRRTIYIYNNIKRIYIYIYMSAPINTVYRRHTMRRNSVAKAM